MSRFEKFLKTKIGKLALPFTVVVLIYNSWFLNFGVRTSGDWGFMLAATADTLRRHYFSIWLSDSQFGRVLIDAGQAPTYAIYGWLSHYLNFSYALNERIVHLWPAVIVALISSYLLTNYIFRDRVAASLGMIVYSANTYYLALLTGGLTLVVAYAFAPLILLFYIKSIQFRSIKYSILTGLFLAVAGAYEPRITFIIIAVLGLYALVHFLLIYPSALKKHWKSLIKIVALYGAPVFLFAMLNVYWVLGLSKAGGADSTVIASNLFGDDFFDASQALTLFHPFWTGGQIQPFFTHPIPLYFWLIPVLAILGIVLSRKKPILLFFALVGILGILLTKQSAEPFPALYYWMFMNVPGFNAFREASKFYILIALAYSILIPAVYVYVKHKYKKKWILNIAAVGIAALFLPNLIPMATNNIGATFRERSIPESYVKINDLVDEDNYSRVLWVPQKSRWSFLSASHPIVSGSTLLTTLQPDLGDTYEDNNNATRTDEISQLMNENYMPVIMSNAAIKYVIVPLRDIKNEDNFYRSYNDDPEMFVRALSGAGYLEKRDVNIEGFTVYESKVPVKPYFSSLDKLYSLADGKEVSAGYDFWQKSLNDKDDFNFVLETEKPYTTDVRDLFGTIKGSDLKDAQLPMQSQSKDKKSDYYFDRSYQQTSYVAKNDSMTFQTTGLVMPVRTVESTLPKNQVLPLERNKNYIVKTGDVINAVKKDSKQVNLGSPKDQSSVYSLDSENIVPKPVIDGALWNKKVEDCVSYNESDPDIWQWSRKDDVLNKQVIALFSKNHAACTGPPTMPVDEGEYLLTFNYRGSSAQFAGYSLEYNDKAKQKIVRDIPIADSDWNVQKVVIDVPAGASEVKLRLISRPSNQLKNNAIVSYANVELKRVSKLATIDTATGNINKVAVEKKSVDGATYPGFPYENLIDNGSFEDGAWQEKVGDCNAYDDRPALRMSVINESKIQTGKALQLEARRHTACTSTPKIDVEGGSSYLLQFDYQSPNSTSAGYVITLYGNDSNKTSRQIKVPNKSKNTFTTNITIPSDVNSLTLALFAYSPTDEATYQVNVYDNVLLQKIPDVMNRFYSVAQPTVALEKPDKIEFNATSNTRKEVKIQGARQPFVLLMSEQYHPSWTAVLDGEKQSILPWVKQASIPSQNHIKANGFQNAWYVDPQNVCSASPDSCIKQADGSYNINLAINFEAQRWFNFGLLISGATLLLAIFTLLFLRFHNPKEKHPVNQPRNKR